MYFLNLLFIFSPIKCVVTSISTSMGTEFLVAVPMLMDDENTHNSGITFVMTTSARKPVTVMITCPGFKGEPKLNEAVSLLRLMPVEYQIPSKYRSEVEVGPKWSYKLMSDTIFALYVLLMASSKSVDTFLALPTVAWRKQYLAITVSVTPSLQIISAKEDNTVRVLLQFLGVSTSILYEGRRYGNNDTLQFKLQVGEAFAVSKCRNHQYVSLSGSLITGSKEIGVISGNCKAQLTTHVCNNKHEIAHPKSKDIVAEMMPSSKTSGFTFILIDMPKRWVNGSYYIVGASGTELTVTHADKVKQIFIDDKRIIYLDTPTCCSHVKSNQPVQVAFVARPACVRMGHDYQVVVEEPQGDGSLAMLVPNELFYVIYAWRTPDTLDLYGSFAALVVKSEQIPDLRLNDRKLYKGIFDWKQVAGGSEYKVDHVSVGDGVQVLTSLKNARFGCYIYGLGHEIMYMHPAALQDCASFPADQKDVDCDARFDEVPEKNESTLSASNVTLSTPLWAPSTTSGSLSTPSAVHPTHWVSWVYMVGFYVLLLLLGILTVCMIKHKNKGYERE